MFLIDFKKKWLVSDREFCRIKYNGKSITRSDKMSTVLKITGLFSPLSFDKVSTVLEITGVFSPLAFFSKT